MCTQHREEPALPGRGDREGGQWKRNGTDKIALDHVENPTERHLKECEKTGDCYTKIQESDGTAINYRKNNYTVWGKLVKVHY